jgi:GTPase
VAAFRATLEEVLEADIILHIRDIAHEESEAQKADVMKVLHELGVNEDERMIVEVLNKIDLLDSDVRAAMLVQNRARGGKAAVKQIAISALTGEGTSELLLLLDRLLSHAESAMRLTLDSSDGAAIAWAYANGRVLERRHSGKTVHLLVACDPVHLERFIAHYGKRLAIVEPAQRHQARS